MPFMVTFLPLLSEPAVPKGANAIPGMRQQPCETRRERERDTFPCLREPHPLLTPLTELFPVVAIVTLSNFQHSFSNILHSFHTQLPHRRGFVYFPPDCNLTFIISLLSVLVCLKRNTACQDVKKNTNS